MNLATVHQRTRPQAARIARHLTGGAIAADAWVSTQAAYRLDAATLLRPAVMVVAGEPPYDGVVTGGVAAVIELDSRLAQRWLPCDVGVIWAPHGDGVIALAGGSRSVIAASAVLTVPGYPSLTLPAELLARTPGEGTVLDLHR